MNRTSRFYTVFACLLALSTMFSVAKAQDANEILEATGVKGGLVVHIGCGDGTLTAALHANDSYLVQGLDTNPNNIGQARVHIQSLGLYGKVSVEHWTSNTLPYIDNLVNLVVSENLGGIAMDEVMRVLAPKGAAYIKDGESWTKTVKPRPAEIDEWPQYLRDASNNAVARDTVVGPPRHLQWTTDPVWSRSHMGISTVISMVSSKGRLFSIEDKGTTENPFLPGKFTLVARDAFNGIKLWSHNFSDWECITRYIKDMAVQLQRRLAAIDDTVYCTPGLSAPVKAFDAASGEVIKVYEGTTNTQEFAYDDSVLYLVIGDRMNCARYNIVKTYSGKGVSLGGSDPNASFDGCGFDAAYAPEINDINNPTCDIVAIDANSGAELWRESNIVNYVGGTLAIRGTNLVYQTENGLFCLNPATGSERWSVSKSISSGDGTSPNTLVLTDDAVYAKENGSLYAYSLADGAYKWDVAVDNNYEKSADVFYTGGVVWTGGSGKPKSYNPNTGALISTITQQKTGPMGHDRCYRNFITERYYINSKTGGADFLLLSDGTEFPHYWTRGTCGFGVLPCNGLVYATPFSCQCSIEVMIQNMNAYYTEPGLTSPDDPIDVETNDILVTGPAYNYIDAGYNATGWPTYRHDGQRSGATTNSVPASEMVSSWEFQLTNPSALTVEDGKVFVSDVDAHTVYALDDSNGHPIWNYVAGSRVDSPPTFYKGLVLFGSRDGWVYCLKADDGSLSWRFKGLPDKMVCAFGQLESAWPVCGSVLVKDGVAYFAAGRSSFLDGGIFHYGLNPETGAVVYRSHVYGPFAGGFPDDSGAAYKSGIFLTDGNKLYLRGKTFDAQLNPVDSPEIHIIATPGFLDRTPQHRTYWRFSSGYGGKNIVDDYGEMLVLDGTDLYEMRGFPVARHSYFDPRLRGYELRKTGGWSVDIPMTTRVMLLAGDVLYVAGNPMKDLLVYDPNNRIEEAQTYVASYAGELGGVMWAFSKADGSKLAEYRLDAAPVWDGMAAANGRLYLSLKNGQVQCLGGTNWPPKVDAGEDQVLYPMSPAILDANVTDDGFPKVDPCDPCSAPIGVTTSWTKFDGPGQVSFDDPCVIDTNASFSQWGQYSLRLTAFDGSASHYDDIDIYVCRPGDLDCDNDVDILDVGKFVTQWLFDECSPLNDWCSGADQTASGSVAFDGYSIVALNWLLGIEPTAPTNLVAVPGDSRISLDWDDNTEADLAGYNVYRSLSSGSGYTKLNGSLLTDSNYLDTSVSNYVTYYYVVSAEDTSGYESEYCDEVSATPGVEPVMNLIASIGITTVGTDVSEWEDQAKNNDAYQSEDVNRPELIPSAINGEPAIEFDGTGEHLDVADSSDINTGDSYSAKTLVVVFKTSSDIATRQVIWEQGGGSNGLNFYIDSGLLYINGWSSWGPTGLNRAISVNTAYVATMVVDSVGTIFEGFVNGASIDTFTPITDLAKHGGDCAFGHVEVKTKFHDGTTGGPGNFAGQIAEFYEFNEVLSSSNRQGLEDALMSKYGIGGG